MIGAIRGRVLAERGATVVVDVNGVGYELTITDRARGLIPGERESGQQGAEVSFVVFTDVRENAIQLFGFADSLEKEIFLLLRKVKGIGGKVALSIVSALPPVEILSAIGHGDTRELTRVPGVGKKLAERMIVELREYVGELARDNDSGLSRKIQISPVERTAPGGQESDVVLALEKLGFSTEHARDIVRRTVKQCQEKDPAALSSAETLLRYSLTNL